MRIVADVNVIVSSTIGPLGTSRSIIRAWRDSRLTLITSDGMLSEVEAKLRSSRIARRYSLTEEDIYATIAVLRTQAEVVVVLPPQITAVTGDPEDDYVLATALSGQARYLVTGDKKLQRLATYHDVIIVSPRQFLDILHTAD